MTTRGQMKLLRLAAAVAAVAFMAPAARADVLRVCADPDNLPFSKSEGPERGMYVELAELVARRLGAPVEYVWWLTFNQRRALRNTILQDGCDAVFALPADADYKARGLQRTQAFLQVGYALVAPPSFVFNALADLKGKRIAVQFMTTPHVFFSQHEGFNTTTFRTAEEVLDALAKGEVDAAFLWGPVAGYENKTRYAGRWKVTPVTGNGMEGQVAVAVRKGKDALAADIDKALKELQPDIAALADKYGFPRGKPVDLGRSSSIAHDGMRMARIPPAAFVLTNAPGGTKADAAGDPVVAGRVRFNDQCSHCHGTDGASPIRERDLRRLKMRYDAKWLETASTTIRNGRLDMGMPAWKEVLDDKQIQQVLGFLGTIQK